jgi:hypothetical protein
MMGDDHLANSSLTFLGTTVAIQVWHDADAQWLYARWRGPYEHHAAGEGWALLVECQRQYGCAKLLNDAREAATGWSGREQWACEKLYPQLAQAGVHFVACIYPRASSGHFSLDTTLVNASHHFVAVFEDLAMACSWLQQQEAPESTRRKPSCLVSGRYAEREPMAVGREKQTTPRCR